MTTARRQIVLTLAVAFAGAAVMLATSRTRNPAFMFCTTDAHGWPFPWRMDYCPCGDETVHHRTDYWLCNFAILLGASFFIGQCVRGKSVAQPTLAVIAMLTIAPLIAVAILLCCGNDRSDLFHPIVVATYMLRGMALNWLTYIPAIIVIPVLMGWISARRSFRQFSLERLLTLSVSAGSAGGLCVVLPMVLEALDGGGHWVFRLLFAGAASGAITLTLISLLYRRLDSRAEPGASPNGGPAMRLGSSGGMEGPPSVS